MKCLAAYAAILCMLADSSAQAQLKVVTTTPTLADIVRQVGGDHVQVESIMRGPENPHNVIPKPSFVMKLRGADLFVHMGLDTEPWVPELVKGSRQQRLHPGNDSNVDASKGITLLEIPQRGELTRAQGDIHAYGNPHYALDPLNGIIIARTIADALRRKDAAHAQDFEANYSDFARRIRELTERLVMQMKPYAGTKIVVYHRVWPYFFERFGLVKAAEIEPKPGISPGPQHLSRVVETMKDQHVKIVIVETFNNLADAESVANRAGGKAIVLPTDVNAAPQAKSYEALFEHNIGALIEAFKSVGIEPSATQPQGGQSEGDTSKTDSDHQGME
ncbi:MAG: metal ABC transporter substrate-binding protein [Phycisphaerales bacterium]|nr:metal ABC transporter substrate-binding protein [Phycisphaerales bacterium]MCI0629697.1 metal ABC transporter substrate-binding protein [Phycisphaerales bacterium]MCI0675422.1 metal ABC transporter substrate-binding protein [Phycisphaerales bacterium]